MTLRQHRLDPGSLQTLLVIDSPGPAQLTEAHRASLSARFRSIPTLESRRIDAWSVERAGAPATGFVWSVRTAKRIIGNAALRRAVDGEVVADGVRDEVADALVNASRGAARPGSLAHWLSGLSNAHLGLVIAESSAWALTMLECLEEIDSTWQVATSDAYYSVSGARTTLRGRRDVECLDGTERVLLRFRSGAPGPSAGPGLRADLVIDALAHPEGLAARRIVGLWPDAGLALSVDGTMADLRLGARDLVRCAVVRRRLDTAKAA